MHGVWVLETRVSVHSGHSVLLRHQVTFQANFYEFIIHNYHNFFSPATQMEATVRAILLKDVQGAKVDSGPKSAIKKFIGSATRSPANVLSGELLLGHVNDDHYNYVLSRDSSVFMFCDVNDTASLNHDEFLLLEAIERPCDRLTAFRRLEWGVSLTVDSAVSVTLPEEISINKRVSATVQYKGTIGKLPGIHFGVEILVSLKLIVGTY